MSAEENGMERKTYAGHGKPDRFRFGGTGTSPNTLGPIVTVGMQGKQMVIVSVETEETIAHITGNTKFWAKVSVDTDPSGNPDTPEKKAVRHILNLENEREQLRRQVDLLADANEEYKRQLQEAKAEADRLKATPGLGDVLTYVRKIRDRADEKRSDFKATKATHGEQLSYRYNTGAFHAADAIATFVSDMEQLTGE